MMHVDWLNFQPISSLVGGVLIGIGAAILVLFKGRIAGISGIVGMLFQTQATPKDHYLWRILFLMGLLLASWAYRFFAALPISQIDASYPQILLAGLLVGFGTRMGSGCTSGHGVCGMGRLSIRSLVATCSFMFSGFVVCYILLHGHFQ